MDCLNEWDFLKPSESQELVKIGQELLKLEGEQRYIKMVCYAYQLYREGMTDSLERAWCLVAETYANVMTIQTLTEVKERMK